MSALERCWWLYRLRIPVVASEDPQTSILTNLSLAVLLCLFAFVCNAQDVRKRNAKDADTWSSEEYSGLRGTKEVRTAMASKGFTWITGSPADNEKLAIGKNAQFFGFVALRYQSGRSANRGMLGRAMFAVASDEQRAEMARAVVNEKAALKAWWDRRSQILAVLEEHLYTGSPIDEGSLFRLGEDFSLLNAEVAIHEARAYAAFESMMSDDQAKLIAKWRDDPETASKHGRAGRVDDDRVASSDQKLLEDLYAKCFSWLSGRREDNEIIPIGQPAQFFGFVAIRHKSGRGANRGDIATAFSRILNSRQRALIGRAANEQMPLLREYLEARHEFLNQLQSLRSAPTLFDQGEADELARQMGRAEMAIAIIEAETYRNIRATLSPAQLQAAMQLRREYVVDESQIAQLDMAERGAALSVLCSGCHGAPGAWRSGMVGPNLDGFWGRPIASEEQFDYSAALRAVSMQSGAQWTEELLDDFLANPKEFAPGTKMEFQGFLDPEDRRAIIEHLRTY